MYIVKAFILTKYRDAQNGHHELVDTGLVAYVTDMLIYLQLCSDFR